MLKGLPLDEAQVWSAEIEHIPAEVRRLEAELYQTRWFDYWGLLPLQATHKFALAYCQAYQDAYAHSYDLEASRHQKPLRVDSLIGSPDLVALTRARQAADSFGCKYEYYLSRAFKRCFERCWRYLPRPNQLYSEELVMDVRDQWEADKAQSLQLASPAVNDCAHPAHDAYHLYLVEQIKNRGEPVGVIARLVYRAHLLPEHVAQEHFSAELMERAASFYQP